MDRRTFLFTSGSGVLGSGMISASSVCSSSPEIPWICVTCGTQYIPSVRPRTACAICEDPRQYVGWEGQQWTCMETLSSIYRNTFEEEEPNLTSIHTEPSFAINQRAFVLKTAEGNILWDCVALLDQNTVARIKALGGLKAIAISHPHYYTTMIEWSRTFDAPIFLHALNRKWVCRPDACIHFWEGETLTLPGGLTLIRTGGHFEGFQVLHWPGGAQGKGVLLAGDQPEVCSARNWVTFMYSYPNYIPLGPTALRGILDALRPFSYDRLYAAFPGRNISTNAKLVVERSAHRYLNAIDS